MDVCSHCFNDITLKAHIESISDNYDICPQCGSNGPIVDVGALFDVFFGLSRFYTTSENATSVLFSNRIQSDWNVFSHGNSKFHQQFISEVFKETAPEYLRPQKWIKIDHPEIKKEWNLYADDIKHSNRFFFARPFRDIQLDRLYSLLEETLEIGERLFRARLNTFGKRYTKRRMGAPSKIDANGGRANPQGIPYLYLASDFETAIAEIRPAKGQSVTVGYFEVLTKLRVVRFSKMSPFKLVLSDSEDDLNLSKINKVLEFIMHKLSEPINPLIANTEYLTTQYICEEIKRMGFNGVSFPSAMGTGMNYALFNTSDYCICRTTKQRYISDISYNIK
jgi:hypothetical protein